MGLSLLFKSGGNGVVVSGPRIDRATFSVMRAADDLMLHAKDAAAQLRECAASEVVQERARACADGFEQGRREGIVAVLATLEIERRTRMLLAGALSDVVEQCVRNLIGEIGDVALFQERVRHLLRTAGGTAGQVSLHVCPRQAHMAQAMVERLADERGDAFWVSVVSDDDCEVDTLILETQFGFVDAAIELTLNGAREILQRALERADLQWVASEGGSLR